MTIKLPGDLSVSTLIDRYIRVNHAGEFGAKRIYEGQLAILKNSVSAQLIEEMKAQELKHLEYFEQQLLIRRIRPTLLYPLWNVAGFMLGMTSALLGSKAAMACTVAVEEVIDEHYANQLKEIPATESELADKIQQFRLEELEHKDTAIEQQAQETMFYNSFCGIIKIGCRAAIWLSSRI